MSKPRALQTFTIYLRYDRFFVLLATHGKHPFFAEEAANIRDIRKVPIKFAGHSITYKQGGFLRKEGSEPAKVDRAWHSRVQIEREKYTQLKAYFLDVAAKRSAEWLGRELFNLPFEPYAPVRQQLLNLLRLIKKARHAAGLDRLSAEVLRYQRRIVKPFDAFVPSRTETPSAPSESQLFHGNVYLDLKPVHGVQLRSQRSIGASDYDSAILTDR